MKKTILSLAVLFATTFSFSALAQAPAASCDKACEGKAPKTECCQAALFEGITLTADQQAKLQEINANRAKAAKEAKEAKKDAKKADKKNCRKDYLNSIKSVLTPDQYVTFLENAFVSGPGKDARHMDGDKKASVKGAMKAHAPKGKGDFKGKKAKGCSGDCAKEKAAAEKK